MGMAEVLRYLRNGSNRTIEGISANTGIGTDIVSNMIRDLEYHQFITVERKDHERSVYGLTPSGVRLEQLISEIYNLGAEL